MSGEQEEFAKIGFVFAAALTVLSGVVASDWQSDEIFIALGIYPLGLGFLVWPAVGYLLAGAKSEFGRSACLSAVTIYNYWVAERLTAAGAEAPSLIGRLWDGNRLGLAVLAALFVGGQLVIVLPQVWRRYRAPRTI